MKFSSKIMLSLVAVVSLVTMQVRAVNVPVTIGGTAVALAGTAGATVAISVAASNPLVLLINPKQDKTAKIVGCSLLVVAAGLAGMAYGLSH